MPLQKQVVDVPFGLGIDTQTDEKNILPGKLVTLENGQFDKLGRVSKRPGTVQLSSLSAFKPFGADDNFLYFRDPATGAVYLQGRDGAVMQSDYDFVFPRLVGDTLASRTSVVSFVEQPMVAQDLAMDTVGKQIGLAVYTDASNALWCCHFDYDSMRPFNNDVASLGGFGTTAQNARVLARGTAGKFIVGVYDGSNALKIYDNITPGTAAYVGNANNTYALGSPVVSLTGLNAVPYWDWFLLGSVLYVVYWNSTGTTLTLAKYTVGTWTPTTATIAATSITCLTVTANSSQGLVGVYFAKSTGISYASYDATTLASVQAVSQIFATAGTYELITASMPDSPLNAMCIAAQGLFSGRTQTYQRSVLAGSAQLNGAGATMLEYTSLALAGKFTSDQFLPTLYDSPLQRTMFFHRLDPTRFISSMAICGRIFYGAGSGLIQGRCLPQTVELSRDGVNGDLVVGTQIAAVDTSTATSAVKRAVLAYAEAQKPGGRIKPKAVLNGRLYFGGGLLHVSGARGINPVGFLLFPELTAAAQGATGGSVADGQYAVCCTFEYTDEFGDVHESAPSLPISFTVSGGAGSATISASAWSPFPCPNFVALQNTFTVFYRTVANGTTFYRDKRVQSAPVTNISLTASNAVLQAQAILNGGEAEPAQPDAPLAIVSDVDRLWVSPGYHRNNVLPSKPKQFGRGAAFFPDVFRVTPGLNDGVTALARQDGKILAFKRRGCSVVTGNGPDATGANDDLGEFANLFLNIGAENHNAVLTNNMGVYAKDPTDIWRIGRDLQLSRIGAEVESFTTITIRDSVAIPASRQVRFLLGAEAASCTELVYDEDTQQWTVNTRGANSNLRPGITLFNEVVYYYLAGLGLSESGAVFTDNGVGYSLKFVTAWLKPAQVLEGFARIYQAMILGDALSSHTLQVRVRFDYETAFSETHTITSANATIGSTAYQPEIRFKRQKCESFQLEITDLTPTGQAYQISGLELIVGVKPGSKRQNKAKRF